MIPRHINLRPETAEDEAFLRRLNIAVRWHQFAMLPLPDAQKMALLELQYDARFQHYRMAYPDADFGVVEHEGAPIGRFYVDRTAEEFVLLDIALLPEQHGRGAGSWLIDALLAEAGAAGRRVALHVDPFNPARRLYQRKGFRDVEQVGPDWRMLWEPR